MSWNYDVFAIQGVMIERQYKKVVRKSCECADENKTGLHCSRCGVKVTADKIVKEKGHEVEKWGDS